jgi:uncharacterized protein (TIGR02145 family)
MFIGIQFFKHCSNQIMRERCMKKMLSVQIMGVIICLFIGNLVWTGSPLGFSSAYAQSNMEIIGSVSTPGKAGGVNASGNTAYVTVEDGWFLSIDVSDPANPKIIGSVDTPGYAYGVRIIDQIAYVVDGNGIHAIDISDLANPFIIDSLNTPGHAREFTIVNQKAFVADYSGGLQAIDIGGGVTECGAYVAPGVWKEFDCYNLAAIGKTTNDDPFTPSWRLIGGYWQWGRKGPDSIQWYGTNTEHFAHGPTGPGESEAKSDFISSWDDDYAPDGSWFDSYKTANDPCPAGYRVPTKVQWEGVLGNNTQSTVGTWDSDDTNYSSARFFGDKLLLPAAGYHNSSNGKLVHRGNVGYYWSSSEYSSSSAAWDLYLDSGTADASLSNRRFGFSVRYVAKEQWFTLSASPTAGIAPLSVIFTVSGDVDSNPSFAWDFQGNNQVDSTSGPVVSHTYTQPGMYDASVSITGDSGPAQEYYIRIQVSKPPREVPVEEVITGGGEGTKYVAPVNENYEITYQVEPASETVEIDYMDYTYNVVTDAVIGCTVILDSRIINWAYAQSDNELSISLLDAGPSKAVPKTITSSDIFTAPNQSETAVDSKGCLVDGPLDGTMPTLNGGWNLMGMNKSISQNISSLVQGKEEIIASVRKWEGSNWAVYLPGQADGGDAYAQSKGFTLLENINPGEGFWVNATQPITLD